MAKASKPSEHEVITLFPYGNLWTAIDKIITHYNGKLYAYIQMFVIGYCVIFATTLSSKDDAQ